jgi:uncharacterized membrane protein YfcA
MVLLLLISSLAGLVDALVGGGGLLQLPAIVLALPASGPAQLLATNKLASITGTSVSVLTYGRRVKVPWRPVAALVPLAAGGAAGGAALASHLPVAAFRPMVLIALLLVGAYTLARPRMGLRSREPFAPRTHWTLAAVLALGIGCYDGIFGPGTGSFLVFGLVGALGYEFLTATAMAKALNLATNLGALLVFIPQGAPIWWLGGLLGLANLSGGYLGARLAVAKGSAFIRGAFLTVLVLLLLRLAWDLLP